MTSETSNVLKTSAWLMISRACPTLALLAVNMWYARKLDYHEYASYQSAWLWANALTLLGSIGLPKYLLTFGTVGQLFAYHKKWKLLCIGLVTVFSGIMLSPFCSAFHWTEILLFLTLVIFQIIALIYESLLLHTRSNRRIIFSSICFSLFFIAGHLIVQQLHFSLSSWLTMMLVAATIKALTLYTPFIVELNEAEKPTELKWIAANDTLQFITKWLDKIILVYMLSPREYSVYFNGTNEIPLTGLLIATFGAAFSVHTAKSISPELQTIVFRQSASAFSAILLPLFGLCLFFPEEIVTTLFGIQYASSANLFAVMAFIIPLRIAAYTPLLQQQGRGKIIIAGAVIDLLVAIVLMLVLYPIAAVSGVAIAVVVATYCQVVYYVFHILRSHSVALIDLLDWKLLAWRLLAVLLSFASLRYVFLGSVDSISVVSSAVLCVLMMVYYFFRDWRKRQQKVVG